MKTRTRLALLTVLALAAGGCAVAPPPLRDTPRVVATPKSGDLTVLSKPGDSIGQLTPVYVSIANGTDVPRSVVPSQIFALDSSGQRVAPLPPGEAAREAGGAGHLKAVLTSAAVSGVAVGALGSAVGAVAGAALGGAGTGALLGGAIGGGVGMWGGGERGQDEANRQADQQLNALALHGGEVRKDFTISGYVFFPKGQYRGLELLLVNSETGSTEVLNRPWQ